MDENIPQPPPPQGGWWFAWILATIVIPGISLVLLSATPADKNVALALGSLGMVVAIAETLHITASFKLSQYRSSIMTALLIFGGWLLMAASFFLGCVANTK